VPLRVNVNIKSKTIEELVATRKNVMLSAMMDLQTESEQELAQLSQAMGQIKALAAREETEWFNDQVAHANVNEEASVDAQKKAMVLFRRRKDLMEM